MLRHISIVLTLLCATVVQAETRLSQSVWNAIGRIELGSDGYCTGTLVADDLVLTAAHCLFDKSSGQRFDVHQLRFRAGFRDGFSVAEAPVLMAVEHPAYARQKEGALRNLSNDIAVLKLSHPLVAENIKPIEVGFPDLGRGDATLLSYGKGRDHRSSMQSGCRLNAHGHGLVVTSCQAASGTSGAPILQSINGQLKVVSVVSAKARADGEPVALAAIAGRSASDLMAFIEDRRVSSLGQ